MPVLLRHHFKKQSIIGQANTYGVVWRSYPCFFSVKSLTSMQVKGAAEGGLMALNRGTCLVFDVGPPTHNKCTQCIIPDEDSYYMGGKESVHFIECGLSNKLILNSSAALRATDIWSYLSLGHLNAFSQHDQPSFSSTRITYVD
jgi:hypothetical protein